MTRYKKWDLVLVPFPFTSLETTKKRPALVIYRGTISGVDYYIVLFVTSKIPDILAEGDHIIESWEFSGLPKPSMVRMKTASIDGSLIIKKLGDIQGEDRRSIADLLRTTFCGP
jgi:mRNA interferase MazF